MNRRLVSCLSLLLSFFALVTVASDSRAQAASRPDSIALHDSAVAGVQAYEAAAFHGWPGAAVACVPERGVRECAGGWCERTMGRGGCLLGRVVPCPFYSSSGRNGVLCNEDEKVYGPAFRPRSTVQIVALRDTLLKRLDSIAVALPGDPWVAGQRVYYLVASGRHREALVAVSACRAIQAWCALLTGYVHQRAGRPDEAGIAFANALAQLTPETRCEWEDVSPLLTGSAKTAYGAMPCGSAERARLEAGFWWLSDPSWLVAENDRWSEHLARRVEQRVLDDWVAASCASCVKLRSVSTLVTAVTNQSEMMLTGPNDSWWIEYMIPGGAAGGGRGGRGGSAPPARADSVTSRWIGPSVIRRSASARYHFVPSGEAVTAPFTASIDDWALDSGPPPGVSQFRSIADPRLQQRPPERFTPLYAAVVAPMRRTQAGFLRRGDSALVVAGFDFRDDELLYPLMTADRAAASEWTNGFFIYPRPSGDAAHGDSIVERLVGPPTGRVATTMTAPFDTVVIGMESLRPSRPAATSGGGMTGGVLARSRFSMAPPRSTSRRIQLSDVFAYEGTGDAPRTVEGPGGLVDRLASTSEARPTSIAGVYWESYGLAAAERARITLRVVRLGQRSGLLRRAIGRDASEQTVFEFKWEERGATDPKLPTVHTRALDLSTLTPGNYRVRVQLDVSGQPSVTSARDITIAK